MGKEITIQYLKYQKIRSLVGDLTWDLDRLSSDGSQALDDLCKIINDVDKIIKPQINKEEK